MACRRSEFSAFSHRTRPHFFFHLAYLSFGGMRRAGVVKTWRLTGGSRLGAVVPAVAGECDGGNRRGLSAFGTRRPFGQQAGAPEGGNPQRGEAFPLRLLILFLPADARPPGVPDSQ